MGLDRCWGDGMKRLLVRTKSTVSPPDRTDTTGQGKGRTRRWREQGYREESSRRSGRPRDANRDSRCVRGGGAGANRVEITKSRGTVDKHNRKQIAKKLLR